MDYPVKINASRNIDNRVIKKLNKFGFREAGEEYFAVLSDHRFDQFAYFAKKHKLRYYVVSSFSSRSGNYRKQFFTKVRPFVGDYYFCVYCGRLLHRKDVTVDHLYPVGKVRKLPRLQRKLRKQGILSVNDVKNLVPACEKCNAHKAAKMGLWIIRGKLGRHPYLWVLRHGFRIGFLVFGCQYLFQNKEILLPYAELLLSYALFYGEAFMKYIEKYFQFIFAYIAI